MRATMVGAGLLVCAAAAWVGTAPAAGEGSRAALAGANDGGQMEIGAALELRANGRFQYQLSYGALDEMATGRWTPRGDGIVLDSDPVTAPAFELVGGTPGAADGFDVALEVPEGMDAQYFEAAVIFGGNSGRSEQLEATSHHFALKPGEVVSQVALALSVFEIVSPRFTVPPGTHAMRFRFHANDLGHVAFTHQALKRDGNAFVLERFGRTLRFRKRR